VDTSACGYEEEQNCLIDFFIPVLSYLIIISLMAISAGSRYDKTQTGSFLLYYAGALVFLVSDTLLRRND
jgi:uncharacterized membrane protein YhhN